MKKPLKFYLDKWTYNSREKQLEDEELLFDNQCEKVEKGVNGWKSEFNEERKLFIIDFSTPKKQSVNNLCHKTKSNLGVANTPTNTTCWNIKKQPVKNMFLSPTPGPTKVAQRSQQRTMGNNFQAIQNAGKLLGLLKTQVEEIQELKKLLYAQEKKLAKLKTMIKSIVKDISSTKDTSKKAKSIVSHLASPHYSDCQASLEIISNPVFLPPLPKLVSKDLQIILDLSLYKSESIQKHFSKIRQMLYTSIIKSASTKRIKIKGMN